MESPRPVAPRPAGITLRALISARWFLLLLVSALVLGTLHADAAFAGWPPTDRLAVTSTVLFAWAGHNIFAQWLTRRDEVGLGLAGVHLVVDALALTAVLSLCGGASNPFTTLYLVPITLATQVSARWTWTSGVLCLAGFATLFAFSEHQHHFHGHLQGMWVALGLSGALITYFVHRIALDLERKGAELAQLRQAAADTRHLAALGSLAAGAAHELGTPLGTIGLLAGELSTMDADEHDQAVASIRGQVSRCRAILQRMATPELRAESLGNAEGWTPQQLSTLLEEELGAEHGAILRIEAAPDAPTPLCHQPQTAVLQIVRELVRNATLAVADNAAGEVVVQVSSDVTSIVVLVSDNGLGMNEETLAAAFDPFFSRRPEGEGSGLGLYFARAHLRQLGGDIALESSPGAGTRVRVQLPLESAYLPRSESNRGGATSRRRPDPSSMSHSSST